MQINSATSLGNGGPVTINAATLEATASPVAADNRGVVLGDTASTILVDSSQDPDAGRRDQRLRRSEQDRGGI